MKLKKPPYPEVKSSATYYRIQADHRRTALELAQSAMRRTATHDEAELEENLYDLGLEGVMGEWVIESLVQGAYIREYHIWEKSTKEYFNGQHERWDGRAVKWRHPSENHVTIVAAQIALFNAKVSTETIAALDAARSRVNQIKHEPGVLLEHFVQWGELDGLLKAEWNFWDELDPQEEFTPSTKMLG